MFFYNFQFSLFNHFTKLPAIRYFGSDKFKTIKKETRKTGREMQVTLTVMPKVNWTKKINALSFDKKLKKKIKIKLDVYLKSIKKRQSK